MQQIFLFFQRSSFFSDWLEQDVLAGLQGAVHSIHSQIVDHDDDDDGIMMMRG